MQAWWQMWKSEFAGDECEAIIGQALTLPAAQGMIGHGGQPLAASETRRSIIRWIPPSWGVLRSRLDWYFRYANTMAYGFDLSALREVQFTEYCASDVGHYDWHEDLTWTGNLPYHRKLSCVLQLTDPQAYDGCELELEREPPRAEELKAQGTIIVFPSFHKHRVTPITRGRRFSLVAWYDGPKFR